MHKLNLSLCCGDYDINRGLMDGTVDVGGIELNVMTASAPERHWRMIKHREFDVCEFSMGSYLLLADRGADFTAIPAFPHRRFRHSSIFVNPVSNISDPSQLRGRRIGIRSWQTSACFLMKGVLQDEYGVGLTDVDWVTQDSEDVSLTLPNGISLRRAPADTTVTQMLLDGKIDALIYPEVPSSMKAGDGRIVRLFEDGKGIEQSYFRKTGFFPIMHTVVIRNEILERDPWVARSMLEAFRASKDAAYRRIENPRTVVLAWLPNALREQQQLMGSDPWAYDFQRNKTQLDTLLRWAREQGMVTSDLSAADLFVASTLEEPPVYV